LCCGSLHCSTIKELRASHTELRRQQQHAHDSLITLRAEHARLTTEQQTLQTELIALESRIPLPLQRRAEESRLIKTKSTLEKRCAETLARVQALENEYAKIQAQADALQMKLHKLEPTEKALLDEQVSLP
jgi:hypothetical protein